MGIKNLSKLVQGVEISLKDLGICTIGIDASIYIYKYMCTHELSTQYGDYSSPIPSQPSVANANTVAHEQPNVAPEVDTTVILGFIKKANQFMKCNITPVFVFDGKPPEAKRKTIEQRHTQQNKDLAKRIQNIDYTVIKEILDAMGIPWVQAEGEADATLVSLFLNHSIDYILSNDSDILCHLALNKPCNQVIHRCLIKEHNGNTEIYDLHGVLTTLGISTDQFVTLCILCGCDYTGTIKGIGPKNALKCVKAGTIPPSDTVDYDLARECFTCKPMQHVVFKVKPVNQVLKPLLQRYQFSETMIESILHTRQKYTCSQRCLCFKPKVSPM